MGILKGLRRKKIGFWAGDQNNFQFINDFIDFVSTKYKVYRFDYNDDVQELKKQMDQVDVCWFEWGNGPVVPATQLYHHKPIINRIHRYELYSEVPLHIEWQYVNRLLFSSPSMIHKFRDKFEEQSKIVKNEFIPIGVDTELFSFHDKPVTKQIVYVGRIHPHKNPSLLLQIFAKLYSLDNEYKLKVIGGFSDELYEEYFYDQVAKQGLSDAVEYIDRLTHAEMVSHLQQSDFFLITSIIEGLSQASLEAMACGVRPVIFNYYGAEYGFPEKCLYKTVDGAIELIMKPSISRAECRKLVEDGYDKKKCFKNNLSVIEELI